MVFLLLFILMLCLNGIILMISAKLLQKKNVGHQKLDQYYHVMAEWIKKYQGKEIEQCLHSFQNKTVAVYGMKEMGNLILNDLLANHIDVSYVVDKDESISVQADIKKLSPEGELPDVDIMIITASFYFDEIKETLQKKGMKCEIISIDDVIYN